MICLTVILPSVLETQVQDICYKFAVPLTNNMLDYIIESLRYVCGFLAGF